MKTLEEILETWEPVIGLEIHAELTTLTTKMFCGCKLEYGAAPNTHTCPICLGLPGALPVPNKAAIQSIVRAGLATNCDIEKRSMFYRKNYMYPDMAKNFQTTQGPIAFCMRGHLTLDVDGAAVNERYRANSLQVGQQFENIVKTEQGYSAHVGITRIHMEEDAGKMIHIGGDEGRIAGATYSLVDYNRAGTPLIELVTEPDLRTPEEARLFMQKLRQIYMAIGISNCSMEQGSMRCDGNISLRKRGTTTLGTKTELKNLNSFKSLHDGLLYEICRQAEVLEEGGTIYQETRHWDPSLKCTIVMRTKESADDYRLFPEPDLAPFNLSDEFIEDIRASLPELPDEKIQRYQNDYHLSAYDARHIGDVEQASEFFESALACAGDAAVKLAKPLANLVLNDLFAQLSSVDIDEAESDKSYCVLTPCDAVRLVSLVDASELSSRQAKEVLSAVLAGEGSVDDVVSKRGLKQVSDTSVLEGIVDGVLAQFPDKVQEFKAGKTGLMGLFVGQCMKATKGQGNPKLLNEIIAQKLQ